MKSKEEIIAKVRNRFIDYYPNTAKKEGFKCFLSFCVEETIKEIKDEHN